MSNDNEVGVKIRVDETGADTGMRNAVDIFKNGIDQLKGSMQGLGSMFEMVEKHFAVLTAVLAGGAMFREGVEEANKMALAAYDTARVMGISAEKASALNTALEDTFTSSETFTSAAARLNMQLRSNEVALNAAGLKTRDAQGHLRDMQSIMLDAIGTVNSYKEGIDRDQAAMLLFGRSALQLNDMLKLNQQVVDEAAEKNERFGLVVGEQNVEAMNHYRAAMNDMHDVFAGAKKAIGDALIPVLTQLAEWFTNAGPAAITVIKGAIGGLVSVFYGLEEVIDIVWNLFQAFVFSITDPFVGLIRAAAKAMSGDFKGALKDLEENARGDRIRAAWSEAMDNIAKKSQDTRDKIYNLFAKPIPGPEKKDDGKSFNNPLGQSMMPFWEAQLSAQKVAHEKMNAENGTFYEFGKQREANFWGAILSQQGVSVQDRAAVEKKYYDMLLSMREDDFQAHLAAEKTKLDAAKFDAAAQLVIANQMADEISQRYGKDSKEYEALQQQIVRIRQQAAQQQMQIDSIVAKSEQDIREQSLQRARDAADYQTSLHALTNLQRLEMDEQFENEDFQIQERALQRQLDAQRNGPKDPVAIARLNAQLEALEQQHLTKMGQITNKATLEMLKPITNVVDGLQTAMQKAFTGLLNHTMSVRQAMQSIWQGLADSIIQEMARIAAQQIVHWGMEKILGFSEVGKNAAVAASGAYAATAAIPVVGPEMAPGAAASAYAATMSFAGAIPAAAGGWDIPAGVNPMTQLHQREMVLPEKFADVIRGMADGGGAGGSGISVHIHAMDGQSVRRVLIDNQQHLIDALSRATRSGKTPRV